MRTKSIRNSWTLALGTVLLLGSGCSDQPFVVDVPMRVVAIDPAGVGVSRTASVLVSFSEDLVPTTVTDPEAFFVEALDEAGNPSRVDGSINYEPSTFVATFTPTSKLAYSTQHRVTLTTAIKRLRDGGPLPIQVTGMFRTLDPPPLRLVASQPGAEARGVLRDSKVILTFSEPAKCATVVSGISVLEKFDPHPHMGPGERVVTGTWECSEPNSIDIDSCEGNDFCVVTFSPAEPFKYSSDVLVELKGGSREDGAVESYRATKFGGQLPEDLAIPFHVEDPDAFYLVQALPGSNLEGVERTSTIRLVFSEPVDCASLANDNFEVEELLDIHPRLGAQAGTTRETSGSLTCIEPEAGSYACGNGDSADPCVVTFVPNAPFEWSSIITVSLAGANYLPGATPHPQVVESTRATSYGGNLSESIALSFRVLDPPDLMVAAVQPSPGAEMVVRETPLLFDFSEGLNCATVNEQTIEISETLDILLGGATTTVAGSFQCNESSQTITFTPAALFQYSSKIDVMLHGGPFDEATYPDHALESAIATSRSGQLPISMSYSFMSIDPPPLMVIATIPSGNASQIDTNSNIEIVFSEAVDRQTINTSEFPDTLTVVELTDTGTVIHHEGVISFADADIKVIYNPNSDFKLTSTITVTLKADIRSARATSRGGSLGTDVIYSFSTANPPPLLVVSTSPGGFQDNVLADADIVVTFSEAVAHDSITCESFYVEDITDVNQPVPVACDPSGSNFEFAGGDTIVTFNPTSNFAYDAKIQITLSQDIHSAIATSGGGSLPMDVVWSFDVIPVPPVEVVQIMPRDEAQNVAVSTNITVVFNQDVLQSTLVTEENMRSCSADGDCPGVVGCDMGSGYCNPDPANVTVWLNPIVDPNQPSDINNRVDLLLVGYDSTSHTAVFNPAMDLDVGTAYNFTVRGGLTGVRGAHGASIMIADFLSNFMTGINALLATTIPLDGETGVSVATSICAVFLQDINPATITTSSFVIGFTDEFGTHNVPISNFIYSGVDPGTLLPDTTGTYNNNMVCAEVAAQFWDCYPDARPLLYNESYRTTLADSITNADGSVSLTGGYAWSFDTGGPPEVLGAYAENHVVKVDPLSTASDVPINSSFHVVFAVPLDPSTVDNNRLRLLDSSGALVPAAVGLSSDGLEAVLLPSAVLGFSASFSLVLSGGYDGVWLADGSYLEADYKAGFTTSPATVAYISPPTGETLYMTAMAAVVFSRNMYSPSLNDQNIYAQDNTLGTAYQGIVSISSQDMDSCVYTAMPTFIKDHNVSIFVTTGAQDFRGNPLSVPATVTYAAIGEVSGGTSRVPDPVNAANVSPASGSQITGDQEFVLTHIVSAGHLRNRMLPPSYNNNSIILIGTGGGTGCPTDTILATNAFSIGAAAQPDRITIRGTSTFRSGCGYRLTLKQNLFTNLFGLANTASDVVVNYTGEAVRPTLQASNILVDAMVGNDVSADGRNDVWSRTDILATFSEKMEPTSFDAGSFALTCAGNPVAGVISVNSQEARFIPLASLAGGSSCTFAVDTTIADLAGNALQSAVSVSFTIEQVAPTVSSIVPADGATGVPVDSSISINFSEAVDPATLIGSTTSDSGSIQLLDLADNSQVFGCLSVGAIESEVIFSPLQNLRANAPYQIVVTQEVKDFGGTPLDAARTSEFMTQ